MVNRFRIGEARTKYTQSSRWIKELDTSIYVDMNKNAALKKVSALSGLLTRMIKERTPLSTKITLTPAVNDAPCIKCFSFFPDPKKHCVLTALKVEMDPNISVRSRATLITDARSFLFWRILKLMPELEIVYLLPYDKQISKSQVDRTIGKERYDIIFSVKV